MLPKFEMPTIADRNNAKNKCATLKVHEAFFARNIYYIDINLYVINVDKVPRIEKTTKDWFETNFFKQ